jgi:AcrR family transcriptional regulator
MVGAQIVDLAVAARPEGPAPTMKIGASASLCTLCRNTMYKSSKRVFTVQARAGERRRAATQEELLAATKRLLADGAPLAALSVERIVGEAGVARTTFYLHFRDKYDLIERLAAEQEAWIEAAGRRAADDPNLTRTTIDRAIGEIVSSWVENHAVLSAIIELAEYDSRMRETWQRTMHEIAGVAAAVFAGHWSDTGRPPRNPEMVAEVLAWMIERSCHQIARDPAREREVGEALSEVIWRVVRPHDPGPATSPRA